MSLMEFDLDRDVTTAAIVSKTNYEITSPTAASNRTINAFVMEATSTGFLVNAKGTTTTTPLSSALRHISNYFLPVCRPGQSPALGSDCRDLAGHHSRRHERRLGSHSGSCND